MLMFHDLRFHADGTEKPDFVLNHQDYRAAPIIVANRNFGCGSAREGAVYSLIEYGVRVVIAPSFGDIFYFNCLTNGLLAVRLEAAHSQLARRRFSSQPLSWPQAGQTKPSGQRLAARCRAQEASSGKRASKAARDIGRSYFQRLGMTEH